MKLLTKLSLLFIPLLILLILGSSSSAEELPRRGVRSSPKTRLKLSTGLIFDDKTHIPNGFLFYGPFFKFQYGKLSLVYTYKSGSNLRRFKELDDWKLYEHISKRIYLGVFLRSIKQENLISKSISKIHSYGISLFYQIPLSKSAELYLKYFDHLHLDNFNLRDPIIARNRYQILLKVKLAKGSSLLLGWKWTFSKRVSGRLQEISFPSYKLSLSFKF